LISLSATPRPYRLSVPLNSMINHTHEATAAPATPLLNTRAERADSHS
jgi:hypothetical protein